MPAAAYVVDPLLFQCAAVQAWVGEDSTLFIAFWRPAALLVGQDHVQLEKPQAVGAALYCAKVAVDLKQKPMDRFAASRP